MSYGWVITHDKVDTGARGKNDYDDNFRLGHDDTTPGLAVLQSKDSVEFEIYDDDGDLYYIGWLLDQDDEWDESVLVAPLRWAQRFAGATLIKFIGEPTWTCEL